MTHLHLSYRLVFSHPVLILSCPLVVSSCLYPHIFSCSVIFSLCELSYHLLCCCPMLLSSVVLSLYVLLSYPLDLYCLFLSYSLFSCPILVSSLSYPLHFSCPILFSSVVLSSFLCFIILFYCQILCSVLVFYCYILFSAVILSSV